MDKLGIMTVSDELDIDTHAQNFLQIYPFQLAVVFLMTVSDELDIDTDAQNFQQDWPLRLYPV
ncbi:hypothetical protein J6590_063072 [Homalodisca vitripennis]|nr:hypothetical protein J6590_063072 [Homalodisca vitripennis]